MIHKTLASFLLLFILFGCATPKKADLKSANPQDALNNVTQLQEKLKNSQADVLANNFYEDGVSDLNKAKENINEGGEAKETLQYLSQAKAYFLDAQKKTENTPGKFDSILTTRKSVLKVNPYSSKNNTELLRDIDEDLIDDTDNFTKGLEAEENSAFQKRYHSLEVKSVQYRELNNFRDILKSAKNNDADDLAPKTLKKAKTDLLSAENAIEQNPRNDKYFKKQVLQANKSSKLLKDVMNKLTGEAKGSSESVALKLVYQERKVGKLSDTVGSLQKNLSKTKESLNQVSSDLGNQMAKRLSAEAQVRFQKAMDEVRKNFTNDEAEVYQQGERLILRLKKLNFASGSAEIPNSSTSLLAKIESIIKDIQPEKIQVQGHTDSTGNNSWNQKLSLKRAKAVEGFLIARNDRLDTSSYGYGEQKPIASNETSEGRALNRRVDIVIDAK